VRSCFGAWGRQARGRAMSEDRLKGKKTLRVDDFLHEFEKDDIKAGVDIVELFEEFGVKLTKKGKNHLGRCPWHDDKDPSLSVDGEKGLYNCFGCGESGDVFSLVEKMKGCGFKEALEFLRKRKGTVPPAVKPTKKIAAAPSAAAKRADPKTVHKQIYTLTDITEYYHKKLYENKAALSYLEGRGLTNKELYVRFKLGYADGSLLTVCTNGQWEALKTLGIIRDKGGEHFHGCVTFPILDEQERAVSLYGRKTGKAKTAHLYLPGPHQGVFNRKASRVYDEIIVTESIIDALSLVQLDLKNVQSSYGTQGFTEEHVKLLQDDLVKTVVIGFDSDEAGRAAAEKLKEKLVEHEFTVKTIAPPQGKDWNEYLLAGGTREQVQTLIAAAEVTRKEKPPFTVEKQGNVYVFRMDDITYRVIGVKEIFVQDLRVNIKAEKEGDEAFYDKLDLYSARSRTAYGANLASLYGLEQKRVERDLVNMLEHLETERDKALHIEPEQKELMPAEIEAGMRFLKNPYMFEEAASDMSALGYVGEELNKKLIYLAASSRLLDDPISVLILSQAASGKSMLVETVEKLLPKEEVISLTSLSDQALNYVPTLMHKFLVLGEAVHNEVIEHQIREMLSRKELSRLVTVKDVRTGVLESTLKNTPAVVAAVMSTTRQNINAENLSRFFVINTDETRDHSRKIMAAQREKDRLQRVLERKNMVPLILAKHHAAQRLLRKLVVINEYAPLIDFPDVILRVRRDHLRFLNLIKAVCFLRQYQKEVKHTDAFDYIECDTMDYRTAYEIMVKGVLASTLLELPKSAVELYEALRVIAGKLAGQKNVKVNEVSFTQREVREDTGYGQSWIREHMRKLLEYEYLLLTKGGSRGSRWAYRLKADEEINRVNLSMIPTPEEIEEKRRIQSEHSEQK